MTLYERKSFTVPASGDGDCSKGHAMLDKRFRCLRCGEFVHDCTHHGHVWLETDGSLYTRHRGRTPADVPVTCKFCPATATLPAYSQHVAPPHTQTTDGPVPKNP